MYAAEHIAMYARLRDAAEVKTATLDSNRLRMLLTGGAGLAAGAGGTALLMNHLNEKSKEQTRNRSFGAGMATGVAAPHILRSLIDRGGDMGLIAPTSMGGY